LLGPGIVMSVPTAVLGLVDFLGEPAIRAIKQAWYHLIGNVLLTLVSIVDWYLRYQEGAQAGSRDYLWLALVGVLLLLFNGWVGWEMVYRRHVGVSDDIGPTAPTHA